VVGYLDTSVVLAHILQGESSIRHALECGSVVSSELLEIEARRVIHRCRMEGGLDDGGFVRAVERLDKLLSGVSLLALSPGVKKRAMGAFPVNVKTLDALHMASALIYTETRPEDTLLVFSHDASLNRCARALGFSAPLSGAV
jgi:hypothetical protein